jgi:hypothetical protein
LLPGTTPARKKPRALLVPGVDLNAADLRLKSVDVFKENVF